MDHRRGRAWGRAWLAAALLGWLLCAGAPRALADPPLVVLEATAGAPLSGPEARALGPGGGVGLGVYAPLSAKLQLGGRLRGTLLTASPALVASGADAASSAESSGSGLAGLAVLLRLRPAGVTGETRRAQGLFLELGAGPALHAGALRASYEAGVGYGVAMPGVGLAPGLRYAQVLEPVGAEGGEDVRLLMVSMELTFFDAVAAPVVARRELGPIQPPSDRDRDGFADVDDRCPDAAEDRDGHEDLDGCPELDNDGDRVVDDRDRCPEEAEDLDGFADDDGCPELDNDGDRIADADDLCPNERETVNGNADHDGCPDAGVVELQDGRIVIDAHVLFDVARARVHSRARPMLMAIVRLYRQHPEWTRLRIEGHADERGVEAYNRKLSLRRAQNVRRELVQLGIPAGVIEASGHGSSRPRETGGGAWAHGRNRRVEFVVLEDSDTAQRPAAPAAAAALAPAPSSSAPAEPAAADGAGVGTSVASGPPPAASAAPAAPALPPQVVGARVDLRP